MTPRRLLRMAAWMIAAAILLADRPASACPNCKEALSAQPTDASRLADGFNKVYQIEYITFLYLQF